MSIPRAVLHADTGPICHILQLPRQILTCGDMWSHTYYIPYTTDPWRVDLMTGEDIVGASMQVSEVTDRNLAVKAVTASKQKDGTNGRRRKVATRRSQAWARIPSWPALGTQSPATNCVLLVRSLPLAACSDCLQPPLALLRKAGRLRCAASLRMGPQD